MKKLLVALLALHASAALAQSNPGFSDGQRLTGLSLSNAFVGKADATNGVLTNPTITAATLSGLLHMSQPASIQFDGSRVWSGSQGAIGNAQLWSYTNQSGSTSTGNPMAYHFFGVASDTVQVTNPGSGAANIWASLVTGAGIKGFRTTYYGSLSINGTPADNGQYSAGEWQAFANAPANAGGNILYGENPTAGLGASATGQWAVVGSEIDVGALAGSTPTSTTALSLVLSGNHAAHGSDNIDSGLVFGNSDTSTTGWDYGIRFGGPANKFPMVSTGTLIYAWPSPGGGLTIANGIDLHQLTFTGALLVTPNNWSNKNGSGDTLLTVSGLVAAGSNVNHLTLVANGTGGAAQIKAQGADATIGVDIQAQGVTGSVTLYSAGGSNVLFQAAGVSGSDGWLTALPGISASRMIQLLPNGGANNILLGGPLGGGALTTSATAGFPAMPVTNGTPTGIPANSGNGAAFELNVTSKTLNIYIPTVGWYHASLTAGAS